MTKERIQELLGGLEKHIAYRQECIAHPFTTVPGVQQNKAMLSGLQEQQSLCHLALANLETQEFVEGKRGATYCMPRTLLIKKLRGQND